MVQARKVCALAFGLSVLSQLSSAFSDPPTDNAVLTRYPRGSAVPGREGINGFSSSQFPWSNVVSVTDVVTEEMLHADPATAYKAAATKVLQQNISGGVVFFPKGTYSFTGSLIMIDGIVLRGEPVVGNATTSINQGNAQPGPLTPLTLFVFPDRSYSLLQCANCSVSGVVNIHSDGGGVSLLRAQTTSPPTRMFVVLSNLLINVVYKYPVAPPGTGENEWPYRFSTAIGVTADSNVLIANNLMAKATRSVTVNVKFLQSGATPVRSSVSAISSPLSDSITAATCSADITRNTSAPECNKDVHASTHWGSDPDGSLCCNLCKQDVSCAFYWITAIATRTRCGLCMCLNL
jgi:hypothetical protein